MEVNVGYASLWQKSSKSPGVEVSYTDAFRSVLRRIATPEPVIGIVVQGPARTGKSTYLNLLVRFLVESIAEKQLNGVTMTCFHEALPVPGMGPCSASGETVPLPFGVGHGCRPCTSGADACFIRAPAGAFGRSKPLVIALIDCEGTGDMDEEHDAMVNLPAMALCAGGVLISNHHRFPAPRMALDSIQGLLRAAAIVRRSSAAPKIDRPGASAASGTGDAAAARPSYPKPESESEEAPATLVIMARNTEATSPAAAAKQEADLMADEPAGAGARGLGRGVGGRRKAERAERRNQARNEIRRCFGSVHVAAIPGPSDRIDPTKPWPKDFSAAIAAIHESFERSILPVLQDERPRHVLGMEEVELDTHSFVPMMEAIIEQTGKCVESLGPADVMDRIREASISRVSHELAAAVSRAVEAASTRRDMDAAASPAIAKVAVAALEKHLEAAALPMLRRVFRGATLDDAKSTVGSEGGPVSRAMTSLTSALSHSYEAFQSATRSETRRVLAQQSSQARFEQMQGLEDELTEALKADGSHSGTAGPDGASKGESSLQASTHGAIGMHGELERLQTTLSKFEALQSKALSQGPDPGVKIREKLNITWSNQLREAAAGLNGPHGLGRMQANAFRQLAHSLDLKVGTELAAAAGSEEGLFPVGISSQLPLASRMILSSGSSVVSPCGAVVVPDADYRTWSAETVTDTEEVQEAADSVKTDHHRFESRISSFISSMKSQIDELTAKQTEQERRGVSKDYSAIKQELLAKQEEIERGMRMQSESFKKKRSIMNA